MSHLFLPSNAKLIFLFRCETNEKKRRRRREQNVVNRTNLFSTFVEMRLKRGSSSRKIRPRTRLSIGRRTRKEKRNDETSRDDDDRRSSTSNGFPPIERRKRAEDRTADRGRRCRHHREPLRRFLRCLRRLSAMLVAMQKRRQIWVVEFDVVSLSLLEWFGRSCQVRIHIGVVFL